MERAVLRESGAQCCIWKISRQDYEGCLEKNGLFLTESEDCERCWSCPEAFGEGGFRKTVIRNGFELWITDCLFQRDIMCYQEDISAVHFGFCLAGHYTGDLGKQREPFTLRAGEHYLFFARDQNGCGQMATGVRQLCVSLMINPELFLSYFGDDCSLLPEMLQGIVHQDTDACFFQVERITADMHRALRQIIDCPYTGASRKLYIESRCLELMAYQLRQFSGLKAVSALATGRGHVHPAEKSRIEKVRSLLLDNLDAPPNLDDLAEAAGMSHPKLNRCFRQMFGTTVFQYLKHERLKQARVMIEDQGRTVTETAYSVGYSSLSHFAKAYKHHFGISPGADFRRKKTA